MADEPKKDPLQKLRKFGEKLVENAHMVPEGFKVELDKKLAEGKRAAEEARRLAVGAAKEASRFHAERLGGFVEAAGKRIKDVPAAFVEEARKQVAERVEAAKQMGGDALKLGDAKASEQEKYDAAGRLMKRGFDELAARAGDRAWGGGARGGKDGPSPVRAQGGDELIDSAPRLAESAGTGGRERLRDKRAVKRPGEPLGEGEFWKTLHEHGGDWEVVRGAHAHDPDKLARLNAERERHLEDFAGALREHGGDWDTLRDRLLEKDPRRLGTLAATRKEFIDDAMRDAGVSREEMKAIRGKEQSRKPTSDDDVSALHPKQANDVEQKLVEKLRRAGVEHGDTAKALDCNVYTPFQSHRFDPRTHAGHYVEDARRELKHGYVALLRDGGDAGAEVVRRRELALIVERKHIQDSVKAARLAPDEAARRLAGNDLHQAAIGEARAFHAEHLSGKDPAAIAEARCAARQDLAHAVAARQERRSGRAPPLQRASRLGARARDGQLDEPRRLPLERIGRADAARLTRVRLGRADDGRARAHARLLQGARARHAAEPAESRQVPRPDDGRCACVPAGTSRDRRRKGTGSDRAQRAGESHRQTRRR